MITESYPLIITIISSVVYAFVLGLITNYFKLPAILGYLLAGIIIGPYTPGFVADVAVAKQLAEIGVILLMFGVGMHFSFQDLLIVRFVAIVGATLQVAITAIIGLLIFHFSSFALLESLLIGICLSVASTVVLLKGFEQEKLLNNKIGKMAIGWLIVEDLLMVLFLVMLPIIIESNTGKINWQDFLIKLSIILLKIVIFVATMVILVKKYLPKLLHKIHQIQSSELMSLGIIAISGGFAFIAYNVFDTSLALGAFMAGFILNESDAGKKMAESSLALRDLFTVLFFIATGMIFNPAILIQKPLLVFAVFSLITIVRPAVVFILMKMLKQNKQDSLIMACGLAQIGEFSFILGALALKMGSFSNILYDLIIAGSILSIAFNPFLFKILITKKSNKSIL
jgi:CPA2 family monovalent cation:H+ antiporter-2